MKKALLASVAAFALVLGTAGIGFASDFSVLSHADIDGGNVHFSDVGHDNAVSVNALQQVSTGTITISGTHDNTLVDGSFAHDGMKFGNNTFENQILDVNNFALGINQAQQGAVSVAVQSEISNTGGGGHGHGS